MNLQYISDRNGNTVSVVIPIHDWELLKQKYQDIEAELDYTEPSKEEVKENPPGAEGTKINRGRKTINQTC